jgi:hypothetical protein
MNRTTLAYAATTMGAAALALGACSSGGGAAKTVTVTATPSTAGGTTTTAAKPTVAATATQAAVSGLPAPPSGATALQTSDTNGVQYARYSTSEQPNQVVAYYTQAWQGQGYTMNQSGGGGGGWGKYGGADAGATGSKSGSYVDVQSGGSTSGPTYFEVCMGTNQSAVNECGNQSNSGSS